MSKGMRVQPFADLLSWILAEFGQYGRIFGIPHPLFYTPHADAPFRTEMFGHPLATPIGPAAGPHTQLAQNIACAWLSGGRFIELKTVQSLDELEIARPCIDMADEGYNVEWSQELKLDQSLHEYVKAWVLIHILHRLLGHEDRVRMATIFNMSIGYNLAGIQSPPMVRFMDGLQDASGQIAEVHAVLHAQFPQFADIPIPSRIANNVTLSTMHGCPPDEIERISRYLLEERGLHTFVKLNPTLLGQDTVMRILHDELGWHDIDIPDRVFEHDLKYDRAVVMIQELQNTAAEHGLVFGVKLSNTLADANHKRYLPGDEMYMSGRALYPLTMNLYHRLLHQFNGNLAVSYSAGADAVNLTDILAAGARPVTATSDLLKPGGYSRMVQWLEMLETEMRERGTAGLDSLSGDAAARLAHLDRAAAEAVQHPRYKEGRFPHGLPKTDTGLALLDCITAPCVAQCAALQDVPEYAWLIAQGEYDRALALILSRNPLPAVTGYVCTHQCQTRCTRNNYDEPVAIRSLKRFAAEQGTVQIKNPETQNRRVAIIGSGPSGLAAAFFLALNGVQVTVFEARETPGGMLAVAGRYRLPKTVIQADMDRITALGVEIKCNHAISQPPEALLQEGFDAVYVACGFQEDARLEIEGIDGYGVAGGLEFLRHAARLQSGLEPADLGLGRAVSPVSPGARVLVIGGGNTAMDVARTAQRISGEPVTVVYRRTRSEMPADEEEIEGLLQEGNRIEELLSPNRVVLQGRRVAGLECIRNRLGEPDADGRRKPVPIAGTKFVIEADAVILAVGQKPDITFLSGSSVSVHHRQNGGTITVDAHTGRAASQKVYAGGDVARGPGTIIEACADGRRSAEAICREFGIDFQTVPTQAASLTPEETVRVKGLRARQVARQQPQTLPVARRAGFDLVEATLSEAAAQREAARCLQCSTLCDKCVEVCPNRANLAYTTTPVRWRLPLLAWQDGRLEIVGEELFQVNQTRQIVHIDDFCNECGNCATFCVHQGRPYSDKPHLFLCESDFNRELEAASEAPASNSFCITGDSLRWQKAGKEARLRSSPASPGHDRHLVLETEHLRLHLSPEFQVLEMVATGPFEGTLSLQDAAEMAVILEGVTGSLPFLFSTRVRPPS